MKRDDYLKHLDRAFTQTPPELTASVEEAFRRGEEAMKQRHKIMTALSVAAAVAILCAALALAAGTMLKPRRDDVVAARGKGERAPTFSPVPEASPQPEQALVFATEGGVYYHTDAHCMGMLNAVPIAEADALAAGKQPCPVCVTGEAIPEESGTDAALTAEGVVERVRQIDERAAKARGFWVYLSTESNGAWVFYATDYEDREALFEGGAWYIGERTVSLGYSRAVSDWAFFTPRAAEGSMFYGDKENYDIDGERIAGVSELFASVTRTTDGVNRVHVWKIGDDEKVIEVNAGDGLCAIGASGGMLFGLMEEDSGDRCFLREYDGQLYQICGQPEEISAVEKLPGGAALLDELHENGYTVTDCLYRSMGADTEAEVITVNLEQDGKPYHVYLFRETEADALDCERGWDGDMDILTGSGSIRVDAGLPAVTSGGIEATREGRVRDARVGLTSVRTSEPQGEERTATMSRTASMPKAHAELPVYYTPQGKYYHGDASCCGMRNAEAHTLAEAVDDGKARCPVCQPGEPDGINMFRKVFGCGLDTLYPDARYAYTLRDAQTDVREWMLCYSGGSTATYGTPVTMEEWTIRSSIPGHVGETVSRMSVWTNADNALTVWRCAPEPLHAMLEAAEGTLRDRPEMLAGIKSTPLEWLTRTFVTFDGAGEDLLAVTLWFEGQAGTTTFRWVRDEDGGYRLSPPEAEEAE